MTITKNVAGEIDANLLAEKLTELQALFDAGVAGTVAANEAVVVDANKDVKGFRNLRATNIIYQPAAPTSLATAGPATYSIANMLTGTIVRDPAGAGRTDTLDSAANVVAGVPGATVGDIIEFLVINGSSGAFAITIAAGAGGTFDANNNGNKQIAQNQQRSIYVRLTNVTPSSEAYVVYM